MVELCMSGHAFSMALRSILAQTMKAFIGLLTCGSLLTVTAATLPSAADLSSPPSSSLVTAADPAPPDNELRAIRRRRCAAARLLGGDSAPEVGMAECDVRSNGVDDELQTAGMEDYKHKACRKTLNCRG